MGGVAGDRRGRSAQQPRGAVKKPFSDLTPIKSQPWTNITKQAFPDNEEVEAEMAWAALVWKVLLFEAAAYTVERDMGRRLLL